MIEDIHRPLHTALVGCGAIAEMQYLRLLTRHPHCQVTALVDPNPERLEQLAARYDVRGTHSSHTALLSNDVEAAIVAAPNALHASISIDLLGAGIHVLVEKPMALTAAECDQMMQAAERGKAVLAVALMRRYGSAPRFVKWAIDHGLLGAITRFEIADGFVYSWPIKSDFLLRKDMAGGGVLVDTGAHTLDQMLWWFGEVQSFQYCDDNYGGIEADCRLEVEMKSGVKGVVELSRTRDLPNTVIIEGSTAILTANLVTNSVEMVYGKGNVALSGAVNFPHSARPPEKTAGDLIVAVYEDFYRAIRHGQLAAVPAAEGKRSVELIERCYANRRLWELPWVTPATDVVGESAA